jgi:sialidase-1
MTRFRIIALLWLATLPAAAAEKSMPEQTNVFVSGNDGYYGYRIPVIETAPDGSLLALAEARKYNLGDPGMADNDIDLVQKRSSDGGHTWSPMKIIESPGRRWSAGNAATIVDRAAGRVWLHYVRCKPGKNTAAALPGSDDIRNLARTSDDNGRTWSEPIDLTSVARDMKDPHWRCSIPGPGGAIQDRKGRLIVPMWKIPPGVLAIFSDDHGKTWKRGQIVPGNHGDENQVVELADGRILMDVRQNQGPHRWLAVSGDGAESWAGTRPGLTVTPVCCAIKRLSLKSAGAGRDRILWTGPKGPGRNNLVARISYDEGQTFVNERLIYDGPAAYSDITILKDGSAGILWERADYKFINFTRAKLSWLDAP